MSPSHWLTVWFDAEKVTATRYPASAIFVLTVSPRPPMPPVISANFVAIFPPYRDSVPSRLCYGIIAPSGSESNHVQPAVDRDVRARDVARLSGGEVGDEAGDLLGLREPPHGNLLDDGPQALRFHRAYHVSLDIAGRHRVDGDPFLHDLLC